LRGARRLREAAAGMKERIAMRFFIWPDTPEFWGGLAIVLGIIVCVLVYHVLWPPAWKKLLKDRRYDQGLGVYAEHLRHEDATNDDRRRAFAAAVQYLTNEHGIPPEEAAQNLRLLVAQYDRDRSYDLRNEAVAHEQAGAYGLALEYYERAARWQEEHDPKDFQFLQTCVDRVRRKARSR
jgi:tetratricopeptide (TPR) repeat protein